MRLIALACLLSPLFLAASAPAQPQRQPLDEALKQARAQQAAAEAATARLEKAAGAARSEAQRLQAEQAAAAQAIEAAEARITAADAQYRLAAAFVSAHRARLAQEQQPVSSLLAGLAVMAQRPPLLAFADGGGGTDDLVKISVLLDSTLPVIQERTRALSAQLAQGQQLQEQAVSARAELVRSQEDLASRRQRFASLEQRALEQSLSAGGQALRTGDVAIAAGEQMERLRAEQSSSRSAQQLADELASADPSPLRPYPPAGPPLRPPFAYALPVNAPVVEGLGSVNDSGVRSRGTTFVTGRGSQVTAPADGTVRFSGPFGDYDGILILDHGGGWMSLIVNVSSQLKEGDKVRLGDRIGQALGQTTVELSHNGRRFSPALIAGSSQTLSKGMKGS
jgi:septal ring factor EnvC (AmiA/AmiB activator)